MIKKKRNSNKKKQIVPHGSLYLRVGEFVHENMVVLILECLGFEHNDYTYRAFKISQVNDDGDKLVYVSGLRFPRYWKCLFKPKSKEEA